MAGKGQRFIDAGYDVSKPLILVSGEPMIIKGIKTFPHADNWVFVCREEHIVLDHIDSEIKKIFPNSKFIPLNYVTEGQACTCLLAKDLINPEDSVFIGSCDGSIVWDKKKYGELIREDNTDIICFGFTGQNILSLKPKSFGWIKLKDDKKTIENVSVKVPISENPYNDIAVVGFFYFRTARILFEIIEDLIRNNVRINHEFYIDSCINQGIKLGYNAKVFIVDQYIGLGTPEELREYAFWEKYFSHTN